MASTLDPLFSTTLGTSAASVTFTSIPQGYTDLVIETVGSSSTASIQDVYLTFNGSTSNYSFTQVYGNGSTANSNRGSSMARIEVAAYVAPSGEWATSYTNLMSYANTSVAKSVLVRRGVASSYLTMGIAMWNSTAAITSFTLTPGSGNFAANSTFRIYGVKAA